MKTAFMAPHLRSLKEAHRCKGHTSLLDQYQIDKATMHLSSNNTSRCHKNNSKIMKI